MKSWLFVVALMATLASTGVAQAGPIEFEAAPVGTRYYSARGGFLEITRIDGKSVETVNAGDHRAFWLAGFIEMSNPSAYQLDREKAESIWPLEIGKKVQFDMAGSGRFNTSGTWTNEFRVLRAEKIKVAAGVFDTIVVEWYQRGIQGTGLGFIGTTTFWYAPRAGFFVKRVFQQQQGGANRVPPWEVSHIVPP